MPAKHIAPAINLPVCYKTLLTHLKKRARIYNFKSAVKPNLAQRNADDRLAFARRHLHWTADREWARTVYLDEKSFTSDKDSRNRVWRPRGQRSNRRFIKPSTHSGRVSVHTWGWICRRGPRNYTHLFIHLTVSSSRRRRVSSSFRHFVASWSNENFFLWQCRRRRRRVASSFRHCRVVIHRTRVPDRIYVFYLGNLVQITGRLTAALYVQLLENYLLPGVNRLYPDDQVVYVVEDNSPIHTARIVRQWYTDHPRLQRLQWPAASPDLNPIENCWAQMVRQWGPCHARTSETLTRLTAQAWSKLRRRPQYFVNLVDSMPRRMNAVIASEGYQTKY